MNLVADCSVLFERLDEELRQASGLARSLFDKLVASACSRIHFLSKAGGVDRIDRLIEARAWTDAALALVELELPAWKLRRLTYEGGEWFCSLSRQPNVPADFDESADACHALMALSILRAFLQARRIAEQSMSAESPQPKIPLAAVGLACCDNFS